MKNFKESLVCTTSVSISVYRDIHSALKNLHELAFWGTELSLKELIEHSPVLNALLS